MAGNEIEIIIRAVDEMSATVKNIEGNLKKANDNISRTTKTTSNAFTEQTGNLILLGQTANTVDNIFDSYSNMQLRVENSTERVANAQDNLADAQKELTRLTDSGKASSNQLEDAQNKVTRSSRSLVIAQNNLSKTNNAVTGTYISMGVQAVTVIASMGKLSTAIKSLTLASWEFITTPLGMTLAAIAVGLGTGVYFWNKYNTSLDDIKNTNKDLTEGLGYTQTQLKKLADSGAAAKIAIDEYNSSSEKFKNTVDSFNSSLINVITAYKRLISAQKDCIDQNEKIRISNAESAESYKKLTEFTDNYADAITGAYDEMSGVIRTKTREEIDSLIKIQNQEHLLHLAEESGSKSSIRTEQKKLDDMQIEHRNYYDDKRELAELELQKITIDSEKIYDVNQVSMSMTEQIFKGGYDNILANLQTYYYPKLQEMFEKSNDAEVAAYTKKVEDIEALNTRLLELQDIRSEAGIAWTDAESALAEANKTLSEAKNERKYFKDTAKKLMYEYYSELYKTNNYYIDKSPPKKSDWGDILSDFFSTGKINLPKYQDGGYVDSTGMALLHKGEYVLPTELVRSGNSNNPIYNININNLNGFNGRDIARVLQDELSMKLTI